MQSRLLTGDAAGDETLADRTGSAEAAACGGPNGVNCGGAALLNPRPPVAARRHRTIPLLSGSRISRITLLI